MKCFGNFEICRRGVAYDVKSSEDDINQTTDKKSVDTTITRPLLTAVTNHDDFNYVISLFKENTHKNNTISSPLCMIVSFRNYVNYRYARQSRIIIIVPWIMDDRTHVIANTRL